MTAVLEPEGFQTQRASLSACPACVAAPSAERIAELSKPDHARLMLSLPTAHCAACISLVEQAVQATPGVQSARVNLTMKRVSVDADSSVTADQLIKVLAGVGYEAHELDAGLLSATETDKQGRDILMRLGVAFFSMMNVMLLSVAVWSGAEDATRDMFHWISAAIALPTGPRRGCGGQDSGPKAGKSTASRRRRNRRDGRNRWFQRGKSRSPAPRPARSGNPCPSGQPSPRPKPI